MLTQQGLARAQNTQPPALLNTLFDQLKELQSGEPIISGDKLGQFLASEPDKLMILSPSEFFMFVHVVNRCNTHKPQKMARNTFVNFLLPAAQRQSFDYGSMMNKILDFTKQQQVDTSVRQLFDQIRPNVGKEVFERGFNVDPRAMATAQQQHGSIPQPNSYLPGGSFGQQAVRGLNRLVAGTDMMVADVDSYQPNRDLGAYNPSAPLSGHQQSRRILQ